MPSRAHVPAYAGVSVQAGLRFSRAPPPRAPPRRARPAGAHRALLVRAARDELVSAEDLPPAGCSRIRVSLQKPIGLVLEQKSTGLYRGRIFVVDVRPGGAADRDGRIKVGDEVISTSAVIYTESEQYGGVTVRKGMQKVRMRVFGESFDTVITAISTHPGTLPVTLDIQKCE